MPNKDIHGFEEKPQKDIPKGKNYLLVIGIDQYAHCPRLFNAVKDAKDMVQILTKRFQFEKENIIERYDQEATKQNIYGAFRSMATRVTAIDNLIIYFSGHGEYDKLFNLGYWIPVEAAVNSVDQYVPNSEIRNILTAIRSHHTFLMVDSCFSGMLFAQNAGRNITLRKERDPSRWGLTAGRNEIVTDGEKGVNSPFAKSILYQLRTTETPIGVAQLCDKVLEVVSANATQTPRGEPLKVEGHQGGQFVFHLRKDEIADWKETITTGTLTAYQSFLSRYPEGKYHTDASTKVKSLSAAILWDEISQNQESDIATLNNKLRLVNQYVDKYGDQPHYGEALNVGELLEYKKEFLQAKTSEFALRRFLGKRTPNISGAIAINKQAQELLADKNRIDSEQNKAAAQKKTAQLRQEEDQRIAEEDRKKKRQEEEKQKAEIRKQKAVANQKKEKERIAAQKRSTVANPKSTGQVVEQPPGFFKKNSKYLWPLLLLPFIIWGVSKLIPNKSNTIILETKLKTFQDPDSKLWGFKQGSIIAIAASYEDVKDFNNGEALVVKDGKTFFINNKGKCIRDCPDESISIGTPLQSYQGFIKKGLNALSSSIPNLKAAETFFSKAKKIAYDYKLEDSEAEEGLRKCAYLAEELKKMEEDDQTKNKERQTRLEEEDAWKKAKSSGLLADYGRYVKKYPDGKYATDAKRRIAKLRNSETATEKLKTGTFTDSRDRQSYKWVVLEDGKKWMAQNLNYDIRGSRCYENKDIICRRYGRLYTWKEAMKACPPGWRLPSDKDWMAMEKHYGADSRTGYGSKEAYNAFINGGGSGFSAFNGGAHTPESGFMDIKKQGFYWTSSEADAARGLSFNRTFNVHSGQYKKMKTEKTWGNSCRCIED